MVILLSPITHTGKSVVKRLGNAQCITRRILSRAPRRGLVGAGAPLGDGWRATSVMCIRTAQLELQSTVKACVI
eukprot:scaffold20146_cov206-Isochrysis_galbana.AAC.8